MQREAFFFLNALTYNPREFGNRFDGKTVKANQKPKYSSLLSETKIDTKITR